MVPLVIFGRSEYFMDTVSDEDTSLSSELSKCSTVVEYIHINKSFNLTVSAFTISSFNRAAKEQFEALTYVLATLPLAQQGLYRRQKTNYFCARA